MEREINPTLVMSFGRLAAGSNDEQAVKDILVHPEIWEAQRRDGDKIESISGGNFGESTVAAVFRQDGVPVGSILFLTANNEVFVQHTNFLPEHRGAEALACIEAAHRELFCQTPALNLITHCPDWAPATKAMCQKVGAKRMFHANRFAVRDGRVQGATIYYLSAFDWACLHHEEFQDVGEEWHEQVFAKIEPHHDEDPAHNGFLGVALAVGAKQPHKAIAIYNMWAERASYQPGKLLWADGNGASLVDFGEGVCLNSPDGVLSVIPRCQPPQPSSPPPPQ